MYPRGTLADDPIVSPSGSWQLHYADDGHASIVHQDGSVTWVAPERGTLALRDNGELVVLRNGQTVWRSPFVATQALSLRVTDDGDAQLVDQQGLPLFSLCHGPLELRSLGDRAPVSEITVNAVLWSADGRRHVCRHADGSLRHDMRIGPENTTVGTVSADEAAALVRPATWLTWRVAADGGRGSWRLVLVDENDVIVWSAEDR
jgi:hypothetical protein